jgi:hypothetical protein
LLGWQDVDDRIVDEASMMAPPMNLQTVDLNLLVALDTMLNAKPK